MKIDINFMFKKKYVYDKPVPIILGGYVNGLGLVRSFGQKKIPTLLLDHSPSLAQYSKYTKGSICPHPVESEPEFINFLLDLGKKLPNKGFLLATNDIWLIPIIKNKSRLSNYYYFQMSDWNIIEKCWNKEYLYNIASENEIPIPKTYTIRTLQQIDEILQRIQFPCIIKPSVTIGFMESIKSNSRTFLISSLEDLIYLKNQIQMANFVDMSLIIQEYIPGPPSNLYTITSYSNQKSDIIAYSIGHKIRQYPPNTGTITSGEVEYVPEVYQCASKLISALKFHGISNIEFKKNEKDNSYILMEINPRAGMWNYSALMSGVNLPYLAYLDIIGESYGDVPKSSSGKKWIMLSTDLICALFTNKKEGYSNYSLKLSEWLNSIRGERIYAIESWQDPLPGVYHWMTLILSIIKNSFRMDVKNSINLR